MTMSRRSSSSWAASWEAFKADRKSAHWIRFDAHTGVVLKRSKPFDGDGRRFLDIMLSLHRICSPAFPGTFHGADGDPVRDRHRIRRRCLRTLHAKA